MSVSDPIAPTIHPVDPAASRLEGARRGPDVETLAREFEAMLLLQMVRQLRHAFLDEDAGGDGLGAETMTDTVDVEFARYLSAVGGVGLARLLAAHVPEPGPAAAGAESGVDGQEARATPGKASPPVGANPTGLVPGEAMRSASADAPVEPGVGPAAAGLPAVGSLARARAGLPVAPVDIATSVAPLEARGGGSVDSDARPEERLEMPLAADITSAFGWRADPFHGGARFHGGIDLRAAYGREVPVAAPGRVVFAGEQGSYGQTVVVEHAGGYRTRYAHLSAIAVRPGEELASGAVVGRVGQSGRATGPHLHFEVWRGSERVDPLAVAAVWPALKPLATGVDFPIDGDRAWTPSTGADHED